MMKTLKHLNHTIILMMGVLIIAASPSLASEKKTRAVISLSGSGVFSAPPDIARIRSGVLSQAKTAAEALQVNSSTMTKVIGGLKETGIASKDIQTSGFTVNPTFYYDQKNRQNPPKIIGYQVLNQVQITIRQREKLGQILDKVISLGANQVNGISFAIDKPQSMKDEARKLAVQNAMHKAAIYMAATGSKLGRIISISEGHVRQPRPEFDLKTRAMSARAEVPIEAGEQTLSVQVNITWEIE